MARARVGPTLIDVSSVSLAIDPTMKSWKAFRLLLGKTTHADHDQRSPTADWARMVDLIAAADEQGERKLGEQLLEKIPAKDPSITRARTTFRFGALYGSVMKHCFFSHSWVIQTETIRNIDGFRVLSVIPYRTCRRCGAMQRGIHDKFWRDIVWEPLRAGTDITSGRARFFRKPSSLLDQLTHSLGVSRTRVTDRPGSEGDWS